MKNIFFFFFLFILHNQGITQKLCIDETTKYTFTCIDKPNDLVIVTENDIQNYSTTIKFFKRKKEIKNIHIEGQGIYLKIIDKSLFCIVENNDNGYYLNVLEINYLDKFQISENRLKQVINFDDVFDISIENDEASLVWFEKDSTTTKKIINSISQNKIDTVIWNDINPLAYYTSDSLEYIVERDGYNVYVKSKLKYSDSASFNNLFEVTTGLGEFDVHLKMDDSKLFLILRSINSEVWKFEKENSQYYYFEAKAPIIDVSEIRKKTVITYLKIDSQSFNILVLNDIVKRWRLYPFLLFD